ncbi:hypothetical protein [Iamia sp.]|uniref:hypothetical protein n=1 Tax=Iamia sp. TaxID=2722710 RepID=UPI002C427225|nr:hypothetical protein [Iamia sp.]HXH57111.1 hypothetical protein [Iamia sp.]
MAAWFIELLNPFAGPVGGAPSLRCIAAGAAAAGYAMWRQRRTQTPSVESGGAPEADRTDDRPLVGVGGDDR